METDICKLCGNAFIGPDLWFRSGDGWVHGGCLVQMKRRLSTLSVNLAMAAGLELAYLSGHTVGVFRPNKDDHPEVKAAHRKIWRPGCGKPAPGWGGDS